MASLAVISGANSAPRCVPNRTVGRRANGYSRVMSTEQSVQQQFDERWAAWQARGEANDRATRRRFVTMAAIVIVFVAGAVLSGIWGF